MEEITLTYEEHPRIDEIRVISNGAEDTCMLGHWDFTRFAIFLRDSSGTIRGGLEGGIWWGWLHIRKLWVDESLQGKGLGKQLIALAESKAVEKGAHSVWLDVPRFQECGYYEKLGYEIFDMLEECPRGPVRCFLKKTLTDAGESPNQGPSLS
jgi:GNAT superfamily N-acetyltransferase